VRDATCLYFESVVGSADSPWTFVLDVSDGGGQQGGKENGSLAPSPPESWVSPLRFSFREQLDREFAGGTDGPELFVEQRQDEWS
jgi:hypothetical protein